LSLARVFDRSAINAPPASIIEAHIQNLVEAHIRILTGKLNSLVLKISSNGDSALAALDEGLGQAQFDIQAARDEASRKKRELGRLLKAHSRLGKLLFFFSRLIKFVLYSLGLKHRLIKYASRV
jgi:outer membrane murein-binding lipoprotein Lpp